MATDRLSRIAICGHGRAGKDTCANWLAANTVLRCGRTTSQVIAPHVAKRLGLPEERAFAERHKNRQLWFDVGNELRADDPAYLVRECLKDGEIAVGLRNPDELAAARAEGLVDLFVWIARPGPRDPTMKFSAKLCDVIIQNRGTVEELHLKLLALARFARLV